MGLIEQAVFTSAQTDRSSGYQLVARSPGVSEADAAALAAWGPSHDSLVEPAPDATSVNFHALPSGAYCVSRTTAAGWEYSGRGGHRVYTQCLVVAPDVLARFANNPFALLRAAMACGAVQVYDHVPERLEPILLSGRAQPVDHGLLARLVVQPGADKMALLVQVALETECLAVVGQPNGAAALAGLMSCLPMEVRPAFSFSTGLKYSSRRPSRVIAIPNDPAMKRWIENQTAVTLLDLSTEVDVANRSLDGWARLVSRVLSAGRTSYLAHELGKTHGDLTPSDLPALGLQLLEEFDASSLRSDHNAGDGPPPTSEPAEPVMRQQAHAAHAALSGASVSAPPAPEAPSKRLEGTTREIVEKLEYLDDVVFDAISGQERALDELNVLWPTMRKDLGDEMLAESREQYLRYALQIWDSAASTNGIRQASRAVLALDVLCILFDET